MANLPCMGLNASLILHDLVSVYFSPLHHPLQPHQLQKLEGTSESQLASPAFTRLADTG